MNTKRIIELIKLKPDYFIYPFLLVLAYYFGSKEYGALATLRVLLLSFVFLFWYIIY